jgi:hypothetical protein
MVGRVLAVEDLGDVDVEVVKLVVESVGDSVGSFRRVNIKDGSSGLEQINLGIRQVKRR